MIKMNAPVFYGANTMVSGKVAPANELIAELFNEDEVLWEKLAEKIEKIYKDIDDEFVDWLSERTLEYYVVNIQEDEATVSETGGDYVILDIPFEFDDEKAYKDKKDSDEIPF